MSERGMRVRIGVFALASLVLLATLIILFNRVPTVFLVRHHYVIEFDNAPGVTKGTPVRRSGVPIGVVENVVLIDETGKVEVHILVDRKHPLYQDDQPVLVRGALSGDTTIEFMNPRKSESSAPPPGQSELKPPEVIPAGFQLAQEPAPQVPALPQSPKRIPVTPDHRFQGSTRSDVPTVMDKIDRLTPSAEDALREIRKTLDRLTPITEDTLKAYRDLARRTEKMIPDATEVARLSREMVPELRAAAQALTVASERVNSFVVTNQDAFTKAIADFDHTATSIGDLVTPENRRKFNSLLDTMEKSSKRLDPLAQHADDLLRAGQQTVMRLQDSLTQADKVMKNAERATQPVADRAPAIIKKLDEATDQLNQLFVVLNREDGALRRLVADPSLYNNLNEAACQLTRTMPRLDRILRDFEVFADKIARHPESLGVGGVINPSSGLKEGPSSTSHWRVPNR